MWPVPIISLQTFTLRIMRKPVKFLLASSSHLQERITYTLFILLCAAVVCFGPVYAAADGTHFFRGYSPSGNWSVDNNWHDYSLPSMRGGELVAIWSNSLLKSTNDFVPVAPRTNLFLETLEFRTSHELYGNPLTLLCVSSREQPGGNSTVHLDLHSRPPYNLIAAVTNNASLTLAGDVKLYHHGPLGVLGEGDLTISGVISGTSYIEKPPPGYDRSYGELKMSGFGPNTYTGPTTISQGKLRLNRYRTSGLSVVGATAIPRDLTIGTGTNNAASVFVVLERANQITDLSSVTINGSGQLDLNGHFERIRSLTLNGGSVTTGGGILSVATEVFVNASSGASVIAGNLAIEETTIFSLNSSAGLDISANLASASGFTFRGLDPLRPGEVRLGGSNHLASTLAVRNCKITVANPNALGPAVTAFTNRTTLVNSTLELDRVTISNKTLVANLVDSKSTITGRGTCGWWGPVQQWNGARFKIATPAGCTLTLGGVVDGPDRYSKTDPGVLVLAGTDSNELLLDCLEGTVKLSKAPGRNAVTALSVGAGVNAAESAVMQWLADEQVPGEILVRSDGLLDLNGHTETLAGLHGSGAVNLGSGSLTISTTTTDSSYSGSIRGGRAGFSGGDLIMNGTGIWTLSGSSTSFGTTYAGKGVLRVNGTLAHSHVEVASAGTLGGTGTVQSVSFKGTGGVLAPGASVGRLTAQGLASLTNATFEVELNGPDPGSQYDQLVTDQAPILGAFLRRSCELKVLTGFTPAVGSTFMIISNRSSSPISGTFAGRAQDSKFGAGVLYQISYTGGSGNDVVLTRVETPAVTNFTATVGAGQIQLQANGYASVAYILEAAPHLNPPIPWTQIATNAPNASGVIQFPVLEVGQNAQRFYRIASR
jgi:fibronectin-binding autotransporter adhesin